MGKNSKTVCVTGGSGYIGSCLVKKLLERGHTVHATLRNLDDPSKTSLLKSLPGADTRLRLFKADIYSPDDFELAIKGCEFVFHVATPMLHNQQSSQFKDISEAAVYGVKSIVKSCIRSGSVKRLIYTSTAVAASPLKEDGTGFKDSMDESCWTPLNLSLPDVSDQTRAYTDSKILAEKEVLKYNDSENGGLEVVSLDVGLVGGDALQSYMPSSVEVLISQLTGVMDYYKELRFLQELLGKVPILHIEDVCEALIFCMEKPSINGRFLCASDYLTTKEIAGYLQRHCSDTAIAEEYLEGAGREISWGSNKLNELGFEYQYDAKMIIDDSIKFARLVGGLSQ